MKHSHQRNKTKVNTLDHKGQAVPVSYKIPSVLIIVKSCKYPGSRGKKKIYIKGNNMKTKTKIPHCRYSPKIVYAWVN